MVRRALVLSFILILPFLSSSIPASAQPEEFSLQIKTISDSYVAQDNPNWKAGKENFLIIGYSEYFSQHDCHFAPSGGYYQKKVVCKQEYRVGSKRNILVHFDLSPIPPGSEVVEAILQLHAHTPLDTLPVKVFGLTECFKEDEVTWLNKNSSNMWVEAGGTHEKTKLDSGDLGKFKNGPEFYRFNVTDYYRRVVTGDAENCGILITPDPGIYPGPREKTVDICDLQSGECQRILRDGFKEYLLNERTEYYAKFYSKEQALKENVSKYIPTLLIKFRGPTIELVGRPSSVEVHPGEETTLNLTLNGSYPGNLSLQFEVPEGITVVLNRSVSMGSTVEAILRVGEEVPPGEYSFKVVPVVEGYNSSYFRIQEFSGKVTVTKKEVKPTDYFLMLPQYVKVTVPQGGETLFKLSLVPRGKFWAKVHLSSSSPDWMNVTFDPEEGVPSFSSVISVRVNESAPLGTHELVLIGEGGRYTTNVTIKVNVIKAQPTQQTQARTTSTTSAKMETSSPLSRSFTSHTTVVKTITTIEEGGGIETPLLLALAAVIVLAGVGVLLVLRRRSS